MAFLTSMPFGKRRHRLHERAVLACAVLEPLEARQLLCAVRHGLGGGMATRSRGFEPAFAAEQAAAAAPGMPDLHSRPAAPVAIFMDFDGDAATGTTPYSEDGDAA